MVKNKRVVALVDAVEHEALLAMAEMERKSRGDMVRTLIEEGAARRAIWTDEMIAKRAKVYAGSVSD